MSSTSQIVTNLAIVVPVFDLDDVCEFVPTSEDFAVGYKVFFWCYEEQSFITNDKLFDIREEAEAEAIKWHNKLKQKFGILED